MIDLFEDKENLPTEIKKLMSKHKMLFKNKPNAYKDCKQFISELKVIGYTADYGLEGNLINLKKL